jgi:hypothetical protein
MTAYTKIDVAEAHIKTAVRLFFEDRPPVPIHLLACSAREILTWIGKRTGVETIVEEVAGHMATTEADVIKKAHKFANFMKHADRDAAEILEGFSDLDNDPVLFFACHDFGRLAHGMPVEAQVFEAWFFATTVKDLSKGSKDWQEIVANCFDLFPGIRSADRAQQKRIGLHKLTEALADPSLEMEIKRVVELPAKR